MTSIVHSRILRSKEFRSPFQCHMIRNKKRGIFPLCQAFEQLSQASCSCNSDCITLELSLGVSVHKSLPCRANCILRSIKHTIWCLPQNFALLSAYSMFPRSHVCLFLIVDGSPIHYLFRVLLPQGKQFSSPLSTLSQPSFSSFQFSLVKLP